MPGEQLGIITLTNGAAARVSRSRSTTKFLDIATNGRPTVDWLDFYAEASRRPLHGRGRHARGRRRPPTRRRAADREYVGTYGNPYYGPLTVTDDGGGLSMSMGPPDRPTKFVLTHFDGNVFTFDTIGENATGTSGATFTRPSGGPAATVTLEAYDTTGIGTFTRE